MNIYEERLYKDKIERLEDRIYMLDQELENIRVLNRIYKEQKEREESITNVLLQNLDRKGLNKWKK